jgi:hypothetical protein
MEMLEIFQVPPTLNPVIVCILPAECIYEFRKIIRLKFTYFSKQHLQTNIWNEEKIFYFKQELNF